MQSYKNFTEKPKVQEDLDDMTIEDIREDALFDDYEEEEDDFPGMNDYYPNSEAW
jgi:hypothetical protein